MRAFRVTLSERDEDVATALLWEAGTSGLEVGSTPEGDVVLTAYFPDEPDLGTLRARLPFARVEPADVPDVDWVARFREDFRAFRVGRFAITPAWEPPPAAGIPLVVDPGRAFGTGTHETTRLCLVALEEIAGHRPLGRVIDVGAGTGILGIAALRLGASGAVAADLDEDAVASCRAHARLNGSPLLVVRGDGGRPFRDGAFDVVVANLTAPLLVARAAELCALRAPGGRLVLSGLLDTDRLEVQSAFADCRQSAFADCGPPAVRHEGEWAALVYGSGTR
jgi:ribosomal protein L11 methyltransferase